MKKVSINSLENKGFFIVLFLTLALYLYYCWGAGSIGINSNGDTKVAYLTQLAHNFTNRPFNTFPFPDYDNIAKDTDYFLAWWSPGHYAIPLSFARLFSSGLYTGEVATTIVYVLLGLVGFYLLFVQLGFKPILSIVSVLILLTTKQIYWFFLAYGAGELLLFGTIPWILITIFKLKNNRFANFFILCAIGLLGFYCKTTFLIAYLSILLFLFLKTIVNDDGSVPEFPVIFKRIDWKQILSLSSSLVVVYSLIYFFYLKGHETPGNTYSLTILNLQSFIKAIFYPPSTIILNYFSEFEQMEIFIKNSFAYWYFESVFTFILAVIGIISVWVILKRNSGFYVSLVISFAICYFTLFAVLYAKQAAISLEPRHFGVFLWLLVPGILNAFLGLSKKIKIPLLCLFLISLSLNTYYFVRHRYDFSKNFQNYKGMFFSKNDIEIAKEINYLDNKETLGNTLFVIAPWNRELELLIRKNRLLTHGGCTGMPSLMNNALFDQGKSFKGISKKLIVIHKQPVQISQLLNWFPSYKEFIIIKNCKVSGYTIYLGIE